MSLGFASHSTLLAAACTITSGSVLELGAGLGSTPLLHGLCGSQGRELLTVESNKEWLDKVSLYHRSWHKFKLVDSFIDLPEYENEWGLVFVDHGIAEQRSRSIMSLKNVPMIVVHDTCYPQLYGYEYAFRYFRYRWDLNLFPPQTTVLSNHINVQEIFTEFRL